MKGATILPTAHLDLSANDTYHLCLAHLMLLKDTYRSFFTQMALKPNRHVIMDNGVVENGQPMGDDLLLLLSRDTHITEMILPDLIFDSASTLRMSESAIKVCQDREIDVSLMAVPQGRNRKEWRSCCREMLQWPVRSIGISKFVLEYYESRSEALEDIPELIQSKKEIHILGCPGHPREIAKIDEKFEHRIRGVDSAIALAYTQGGLYGGLHPERPDVTLDLEDGSSLDRRLLERNRAWWIHTCRTTFYD